MMFVVTSFFVLPHFEQGYIVFFLCVSGVFFVIPLIQHVLS